MLPVNLLENRREDLEQTIIRHIQERSVPVSVRAVPAGTDRRRGNEYV
jgi:hypothetical protein